MSRRSSSDAKFSCGCYLAVLAFNITLGAWGFDYCLWFIAGKDAPWYGDLIAGAITGQIVFPLAVVFWVLNLVGVQHPLL